VSNSAYNPSEFVLPDFHTVVVPIAARPGAPGTYSTAQFVTDDLELEHDMVLERIVLTEMERQAVVPDTGASILPLIRMRWWESLDQRSYGDFLPLTALDERRPDLSEVDIPAAGAGYAEVVYEPRGPVPLMVKNRHAFVVDWENPTVPAGGVAFPAGQIDVSLHGELADSHRPYAMYLPVAYLIGAVAPAGRVAGTTQPGNASRNDTGQDFIVKRVVIGINTLDYPAMLVDPRIWRHLRVMIRLAGADTERWAPYDERAPIVAFGDRVTVNNHSVTIPFGRLMEGTGKFVAAETSLQHEFRNYSLIATQIIGTFCGWKRQPKGGQG
jgi:hypothetical protein